MYVAVTGASGNLGHYVVADLLAAGHSVKQIDHVLPATSHLPFHIVDIRQLDQVRAGLDGCNAVVHLAAIPSPRAGYADLVFGTNVTGTFNVLESAAMLGIERVVNVSSSSALGVAYAERPVPLQYVPIDEAHPLMPQDVYGLSKQLGEECCAAFHRRTGGVAVSMRFPLIWNHQRDPDLLATLAADEQQGRHTLWSYIDIRDAARACRLAVEVPGVRDEAMYIAAPTTFAQRPSAALARQYFPTAAIRGDEQSYWAFHDCTRAAMLLGFTTNYTWQPNERPVL